MKIMICLLVFTALLIGCSHTPHEITYKTINKYYQIEINETTKKVTATESNPFIDIDSISVNGSISILRPTNDYIFNVDNVSVMFDNMTCVEVTCNCAKNTNTPCMAYCMNCTRIKGGEE